MLIEPFKIKSVEPIYFTTKEQRQQILKDAFYNPFLIRSKNVIIDLLTDSGTGAMSAAQWAGIMIGDESYAGSNSFFHFQETIQNITGLKHILPTHQGRASEKILFSVLGGKGKYFISNTLFDTTRANIEFSGAEGIDLVCDEGKQPSLIAPFKGNMNVDALDKKIIEVGAANVPCVVVTITNNSGGGQPVSMQNIKAVKAICNKYKIPMIIDACRFAENAYFIQQREEGYKNIAILDIAKEMFSYADGATMSAKKDALVNIGGFLALNDDALTMQCRNLLIITEGFPTYGGLAGRDLEAIAIGLKEVMDENYLKHRIGTMQYIGERFEALGIPYVKPTGGHAVYIDAKAFLPNIDAHQFPGLALCNELYLEGGIRGVEIGSVMFGKYDANGNTIPAPMELVRLAIPRRVYTQSHIDYVIETTANIYKNRTQVKGYKMTYETPLLRHFTAQFEQL